MYINDHESSINIWKNKVREVSISLKTKCTLFQFLKPPDRRRYPEPATPKKHSRMEKRQGEKKEKKKDEKTGRIVGG